MARVRFLRLGRSFAVSVVLISGVVAGAAESSVAMPTNAQLTIAISQEFDTLNPLIAQTSAAFLINYMTTRPINAINADWRWQCYLCETMPSLENKMAKIITENGVKKMVVDFVIKKGANWGDGHPVTGYDFKLGWEVGRSKNVAVGLKENYEDIESVDVDAKDPKRFRIKERKLDYQYANLASLRLLPDHVERPIWEKAKNSNGAYEKQSAYLTNPTNPGLYSGPYVVQDFKPASHVTLVPNAHFYGTKPAIQKIIYKVIPNTQTLEANLLSGTVDMICELGMQFDQALAFDNRVKADPKLRNQLEVLFRESTTYEHIDFNLRNPLLQDVRVRQAFLHSVDRQKLVNALFEGKQKVALHFVHPSDPYFTADVKKYPYDPKMAAKLLDEAGWKVGAGGVREKDGKKMVVTLMTTAENKTRELVEVFLQNEWKKIGVETRIKNEPARVFFGETIRKGLFSEMAMYAVVSSPDNPPRASLHSEEIPTAANGYSGQNRTAYVNKIVDKAIDEIQMEFSFEKRKAMMDTIQREYAKDLPQLPLYMRSEVVVVPSNLKGFRMTGHQFYSTLSGEDWTLETPKK